MRAIVILLMALFAAVTSYSQAPGNRNGLQKTKDSIPKVTASNTAELLNDINKAFADVEKSVELAYAKLKKEIREDIDDINDKIKQLEQQIKMLKESIKSLELTEQKLTKRHDSLRTLFNSGKVSASEKQVLAKDILIVEEQIDQTLQKIKDADKQIEEHKKEIQKLKEQLKKLEGQVDQLDKDKQKAIAEAGEQKRKAVSDAQERHEERNYRNTLAIQLKNISLAFKDTIRLTELRYRRISR